MWLLLLSSPCAAADSYVDPELYGPRVADLYLDCLVSFERHAESVWHDAGAPPGAGYFGDGASGGNGGIRGTCGIALAYATLYCSGRGTEADQSRRLTRLGAALRYAAETHVSGAARCVDGKQWGHGWQTSLWAGSLGFAAALVEEVLEEDLVAACKRVIASEADFRASIPPADGHVGDSKAEENAWNSNVPALAACWMPGHANAAAWREAARHYLVNTYTTADREGDPLAEWITTVTLYPSFACENHGFFHPSYQQVSGMSLGDSYVMARVLSPATAAELGPFAEHNVLAAWGCLQKVLLDSAELAYPSGLDWSLHGYGQISYYAYLANHFGDPTARWAEGLLAQHLGHRQWIGEDGRFTGDSVPNGFYREAVMARRVSMAWWQHQVADHPQSPRRAPQPFVDHLADVGLILQRSRRGFASLSYGRRTMALVVPESARHPDEPFIVTPRYPSLIGEGLLGRAASAELRSVAMRRAGFEAELLVQQGAIEQTRVTVLSTGDAFAIIELPMPLIRMSFPEMAAFPVGIENHELTGGERRLTSAKGTQRAFALSGEHVEVDSPWLCVSERLGYIVGPTARVGYDTAPEHNRAGAAEDCLHALPADAMAPRYAVLLPGANSEETQSVAGSVRWEVGDEVAQLSFRAPESGRHRLVLQIPEAPSPRVAVSVVSVASSSASEKHPPELAADGDPNTWWVSNREGPEPGHGPTPERPEFLDFSFPPGSMVGEVVIIPRPGYGPRDVTLLIGEEVVWRGTLTQVAQRITLPEPRDAGSARVLITSAYDPRYPDAPRSVQVGEVIFVAADTP